MQRSGIDQELIQSSLFHADRHGILMAYIFLNAKLDNETATASILQLQGQLMGDIKVIEE